MRMLDALHRARTPRKRSGPATIALGACAVLALGAALPLYATGPQAGGAQPALQSFLTSGGSAAGLQLTMLEGTIGQLKFSKAISETVLANDALAKVEAPAAGSTDQLRIRSLKQGRTNILVTYRDGSSESYDLVVRRDLTSLNLALRAVHPSLRAESEDGTSVIILTGSVPDGSMATRAEDAARAYIGSGRVENTITPGVVNLINVQAAASVLEFNLQEQITKMGGMDVRLSRVQAALQADDKKDVFVLSGSVPTTKMLEDVTSLVRSAINDKDGPDSRLINQLQVGTRPGSIEEVLTRAIHDQLGYTGVTVATVRGADVHGDTDIVLLAGTVPHQTALVRVLALAGRTFEQQVVVDRKRRGQLDRIIESFPTGATRVSEKLPELKSLLSDLRATADESGALLNGDGAGSGSNETGSSLRSVLSTPNGGLSGGGSTGIGQLLENRVGSNIARAKALELANGRILSFIRVEDIPQVRVSIRLFEVSRNDLLSWDSQVNKIGVADFDTNGINPNTPQFDADGQIVTNANGDPILFSSNTDISNVIGFLESGFSNQIQIGGEHFNLDTVFRLLETEGVARTLANPTLTVLSGEVAAFGDGGSVSVTSSVSTTVGGVNGGQGVFESVQLLPFGIQLAVRPLVDEDGYITLDVAPSVSNPDFALTTLVRNTTGQPQETVAFAEKNLRTSARVRDGEVLLIGGLQDRSRTDQAGKTPFLADVPILGWLFQDKSYEDSDRETMITVSPSIVRSRPVEARLWEYPSTLELLGRAPHPKKAAQGSNDPAQTPAKK